MSDESLLKRIEIINNDLYEYKQEAILHRDLAIKAQETATRRKELLREANYFLEYVPDGIEGEEERYHNLMEELAEELK